MGTYHAGDRKYTRTYNFLCAKKNIAQSCVQRNRESSDKAIACRRSSCAHARQAVVSVNVLEFKVFHHNSDDLAIAQWVRRHGATVEIDPV